MKTIKNWKTFNEGWDNEKYPYFDLSYEIFKLEK